MSNVKHFLKDFGVIALSLLFAIALVRTGIVETLLTTTESLRLIGSFVAGLFFTSVFTTAPAIVALGEISSHGSLWVTAAVGALGAVIGDMILFSIVRDRLSDHLLTHVKNSRGWDRIVVLARTRSFRWLSFFLGGIIIASPFPDELGISLLGFTKMPTRWFVPLSYAFNFTGIVAIGGVARLFA